jgi:hypothetical protein
MPFTEGVTYDDVPRIEEAISADPFAGAIPRRSP